MSLTVLAPAKINLTLEMLGVRDDGFHELRSVMQAVSLHDEITVEDAPGEGIMLLGGSPEAPPDESNLVYRAASALAGLADDDLGTRIALQKRIPVGAGLGGGSSDAAATLVALNRVWRLGLSADRLIEIGATLGSDVPFFLTNGTALAEGRGERLTGLPSPDRIWLVLDWPGVKLSTARVYRKFDEGGLPAASGGNASHLLLQSLAGEVGGAAAHLWNDLESAAFSLAGTIRQEKERLLDAGAMGALMCGSGSAVFGLARDKVHADQLAERVRQAGHWTCVCHTVTLPFEGDE